MANLFLCHDDEGNGFLMTEEDFFEHSAKGSKWKFHKYIAIDENGNYIYPGDEAGEGKSLFYDQKNRNDTYSLGKKTYVDLKDNTKKYNDSSKEFYDARTGKKISESRVNANATIAQMRNSSAKTMKLGAAAISSVAKGVKISFKSKEFARLTTFKGFLEGERADALYNTGHKISAYGKLGSSLAKELSGIASKQYKIGKTAAKADYAAKKAAIDLESNARDTGSIRNKLKNSSNRLLYNTKK